MSGKYKEVKKLIKKTLYIAGGIITSVLLSTNVTFAQAPTASPSSSPSPLATVIPSAPPSTGMGGN